MSVLGFLPPIADEITGDLLVDGAYLNPVPVDVLRKLSRVESTIVVDVEDEHYAAFRSLTARDGGLGGWRLLWERVSPFAQAEKLWQSIKSGKRGNKSSSESFNAYSTSSSESESDSSSSDVDGGNTRGGSTPARRKGGKSTKKNKKNKKRSVSTATTNAAPNYATLLGALLRATSRREVAEAAKACEIDVYLRPPGVPPFTFHTGLTDKRTDDLIRRARFKAAEVIRKWQETKRIAMKDDTENTSIQATSYYGFYSSTTQNSQGRLSAMQPIVTTSPRGGGQGTSHVAQTPPRVPFHPSAMQTPTLHPSPATTDSPRGQYRRASFEDVDGEVDSGVAIVSERAFLKPAKTKEDEEAERTEDKKKSITPARQIIDDKAIVKLSGTTNFDEKEHDDVLGKKKTFAEKSSSKLETV